MQSQHPRPVVLCIMDGWGWREEADNNAVRLGDTPVFDRLVETAPMGFLDASEHHVGLPSGQIGNSEVGHMNIGAGRPVLQDLPRIDAAIEAGELATNRALTGLLDKVKKAAGTLHLAGLASPGGVHSHDSHIARLAEIASKAGVPVSLHLWTDGRDVPPRSAAGQVRALLEKIAHLPGVSVASLSGRYYAMDRDKRWDRVERAFNAIIHGQGAETMADAVTAIEASYQTGVTDEFITPKIADGYTGMKNGDGLLVANFRADRARQFLSALLEPDFSDFERGAVPALSGVAGMAEYSSRLGELMDTLFPPQSVTDTLGETVAKAGLKQLRIAETEKYAHVTFFLNGGEEDVFEGEERVMVPSPKVATYDLQPEMAAAEVADGVVKAIEEEKFDLIVVNFANPDMVGHTGNLEAAKKAVAAVDKGVGRIADALEKAGGAMFLTADHGNCEQMIDPTDHGPHTAHTLNRVPAILTGAPAAITALPDGRLADIAPTLLALMGIEIPAAMTGRNLLGGTTADAAEAAAE